MSDNDEVEWFTICNEKNIVLKKNDSNTYKITFSINLKNNEDTVLNVLKNGQLFDLLCALNPDVIDKFDVIEDDGDIHHIFMTFKTGEQEQEQEQESDHTDEIDKIVHVFFSLKYIFKQDRCIAKSQKITDYSSDLNSKIVKLKEGKEFLSISKIKLKAVEINKKTSMCLTFKVDNNKSSNIINMYIGLYFKKIFYRFKQYFE
jgi:hypothetical protein